MKKAPSRKPAAIKGKILCSAKTTVKGEAPSLLPNGKKFKLVWHDEFNGNKLDTTKWGYRTNFWGQKAHWFATPEDKAVVVKNGEVHLKLIRRANGQYASPQLQTGELLWDIPWEKNRKIFWPLPKREKPKFEHTYGYYECRCRLQQEEGWWSAFWMQTATQGVCLDPARAGIEHDIMESFAPGEVLPSCFHMNGYGPDWNMFNSARINGIDFALKRDYNAIVDKTAYHVFGFLWEPDGYTLFRDGVQVSPKLGRGKGEAVSHVPGFILLTTEAKWFRNNKMTGKGVPELADALKAKDEFIVDYVRVYDVVK